jgi:ArsR family transcriptional regulator, lead/cadmium/zinc/bismuth-responsive transcriptional repressor
MPLGASIRGVPQTDVQSGALVPIEPAALARAQAAAPDEIMLAGVAAVFRALADPTRTRILYALANGPLCVRDLAILVEVTESAISHQMRFLREHHLVRPQRRGNVIAYALDDHHVAALFREAEYHVDHVSQGTADHPYP